MSVGGVVLRSDALASALITLFAISGAIMTNFYGQCGGELKNLGQHAMLKDPNHFL